MKIENEFKVSIPMGRAWKVLTDLEGIVTCVPGAQLTGSDGETYQGDVKIKVGPITSKYAGTVTFVEKDDDEFRAVISAKGRDASGAGSVSAVITAHLQPEGDQTKVSLDTDLKITGKIAQFGNSMIVEVSEKILSQFVDNLEAKLSAPRSGDDLDAGNGAEAPDAAATFLAPIVGESTEAIDLMKLAGGSVAKRLVPVVIAVVAVGVILYLIFR